AIVAQARAGFFPTASFTETATRQRTSGGRVGSTGVSGGNTGSISNFFSLTTSASWVPDLWGKVERTVESDVASAQASAGDVARAQLEHAIAVLIGKAPAEFSIAATTEKLAIPDVPPELPAALLERRPDIAAAERRMAAANALIGAAEAAFFPTVTLSADYGVS